MNENMNRPMPPMSGDAENPFGQAFPAISLGNEPAATNPFDAAALGSEPAEPNPFDASRQMAQPVPQALAAQTPDQAAIPAHNLAASMPPAQEVPAQAHTSNSGAPPVPETREEVQNPIAAAMGIQSPGAEDSIYAKRPMFVHGSANEEIEDITQTFEDLRVLKADDFPELEDGSRVTWEVSYGKVRKSLPLKDAKATKIGELKAAIETSKEFTDGLKKSKDKSPVCTVKPRVSAQSKGEILPGYKGIFVTVEEARSSQKVICIVPGRDGKVYEMRHEEAGIFTLPAANHKELSEIRPGFIPALPRIPSALLMEVITFFRSMLFTKTGSYEAIANIFWDKALEQYVVHVPKQTVTAVRAVSDLSQPSEPDSDRYLHYMDIHSHNVLAARFSEVDDRDEKATRLYAVIGRLDSYMPEISVRMGCGGRYHPLDPGEVFEPLHSRYPESWNAQIDVAFSHKTSAFDDLATGAAA